ncbi:MAG: ribonuclease HII [Actinomycetaceae bacterium]|nr:ribonuclease HII [Actinomycetaceae bacterium]MDU0970136.1 ribonuclease HII [Actinomycetaceae bacterium]
MSAAPTRELELSLADRYGLVAGMDEVGRGALAGPVAVGIAVVDAAVGEPPAGLRDSKLLTAPRREALVDPVQAWGRASAVGMASPGEIDAWGIVAALRLAGRRALAQVIEAGWAPAAIILDGVHNWLTIPAPDLLTPEDHPDFDTALPPIPDVVMRVKADRDCAVVAAASVVAKVKRDAYMAELADPGYGWARNKGYSSPTHIDALATLGASAMHRRSWNLPASSKRSMTP